MHIAACEMRFRIRGAKSLKSKRSVTRKIVDRVKSKYPVSIAEVDSHDNLSEARIGFSIVGNDARKLQSMLDKILYYIQDMYVAELLDVDREVMLWSRKRY